VKTDLEISRAAQLRPIADVAADLGFAEADIDLYGQYKAKIHLSATPAAGSAGTGAKYVIVTAMTPTKLGEGKTLTTIGLSQALRVIGKKSIAAIRQPSLGPTFGIKGGGAGGGNSQVVPMDDLNLHLTGDLHAISAAHNLLAAAIDARLYHEDLSSDKRLQRQGLKRLDLDPDTITWGRVVDMNDRALRDIVVSNGNEGVTRNSRFDITAASEVMAIFALATDIKDLRQRLSRIVVGMSRAGEAVTAEDLGAAGAMAVLLKDALMPNLMQTLEGGPALIHAGPFANIAHGNSSIVADKIGLAALGDDGYLVTESGFGSDCGFEKFCDVKCRYSGLRPDCVVIVATVRALKVHGGGPLPGSKEDRAIDAAAGMEHLAKGLGNLRAHIGIARQFGLPAVVSVNRFSDDSDAEIAMVVAGALEAGAAAACPCEMWEKGGEGGRELAEAVTAACDSDDGDFQFLYELGDSIVDKITTIATRIYGAADVELSPLAQDRVEHYTRLGYADLPMIMAKTHLSISHDPKLIGVPEGFTLPVRDLRLSAGAGFLYALCGEIFTMPGLPSVPGFMKVDLDDDGLVVGLS
jgi:formyltetrahydrofolate synthetase